MADVNEASRKADEHFDEAERIRAAIEPFLRAARKWRKRGEDDGSSVPLLLDNGDGSGRYKSGLDLRDLFALLDAVEGTPESAPDALDTFGLKVGDMVKHPLLAGDPVLTVTAFGEGALGVYATVLFPNGESGHLWAKQLVRVDDAR